MLLFSFAVQTENSIEPLEEDIDQEGDNVQCMDCIQSLSLALGSLVAEPTGEAQGVMKGECPEKETLWQRAAVHCSLWPYHILLLFALLSFEQGTVCLVRGIFRTVC